MYWLTEAARNEIQACRESSLAIVITRKRRCEICFDA